MSSLSTTWQIIVIAIAVGAFLIISGGCWIVTAVCEARSLEREAYEKASKDLSGKISDATGDLLATIDSLSKTTAEFVKSNDLFEQILDGEHVAELEASVGSYEDHSELMDIYILASLFTLEQADGVGALLEPIVWNLRKGVTYHYLIPHQEANIKKYKKMLHSWYKLYSVFLDSKDDYQEFCKKYNVKNSSRYSKYWSDSYTQLVNDAGQYWLKGIGEIEDLKTRCKTLFNSHIVTHVEEPSLFFVTVAAYESVTPGKFDAIIKIPTQNPSEKYYALKVSETQNDNFMGQFLALYKEVPFRDQDNRITYGGIYSIDDSIFN